MITHTEPSICLIRHGSKNTADMIDNNGVSSYCLQPSDLWGCWVFLSKVYSNITKICWWYFNTAYKQWVFTATYSKLLDMKRIFQAAIHIRENITKQERLQCCTIQVNTLRLRQNGWNFEDDIFKCIFLNENFCILIKISLKFVPKGPIYNIPATFWIMAWRQSGNRPLTESMMA